MPLGPFYPSGNDFTSIDRKKDFYYYFLKKKDMEYPMYPSSAGDSFNRGKYPSTNPLLSDSIFEHLCRSVDNDYIAHPTDCKRYAYCANGKKRDISYRLFSFFYEEQTCGHRVNRSNAHLVLSTFEQLILIHIN